MGKTGQIIRVSQEMAERLRDIARKNEISIREASKEILKLADSKIGIDKKIIREIKF